MRKLYEAPTGEAAEAHGDDVAEQWRDTYTGDHRFVGERVAEFEPILEFPTEPCKAVYTTNAIGLLNARFRKAVRRRGHFPNEQAALEVR